MPCKRLPSVSPAALLELAGSWLAMLLAAAVCGYFLLAALAEHQVRQTQEARLLVRLSHVRDNIEASLWLGFGLDGLPGAQDLLEDTLGKDPTLLALDIFDEHGRLRFSTDRGSIGEPAPDDWLRARGGDTFSAPAGDARVLGIAVRGAFGEIDGYLVATYRPAVRPAARVGLLIGALAGLALVSLCAAASYLWRLTAAGTETASSRQMSAALSRLSEYDRQFSTAFDALEQQERQS